MVFIQNKILPNLFLLILGEERTENLCYISEFKIRMSTFYKSNQLQALLFRALYLCSALNNHRYWKPNLSLSIRRGNNKYPINPIINAKLNLTSKKRKMLDIWNSWDCTWKNINCFTISCIDYNHQIFLNQLWGSVFRCANISRNYSG